MKIEVSIIKKRGIVVTKDLMKINLEIDLPILGKNQTMDSWIPQLANQTIVFIS